MTARCDQWANIFRDANREARRCIEAKGHTGRGTFAVDTYQHLSNPEQ